MRRFLLLSAALIVGASSAHAASPLSKESSAFLRSYANSPVNWMLWGEAAFARAKQEQKPIFLSVGIFTSELSRAMAQQTFANADTAAFLNESFVCVLVDAKEQPQLAALYQNYIQAVKQLRGLPLNIWLTPELQPFDGANYLPPTEEWGKEGFLTVAKRAAAGWKADPAAQRNKAEEAVAAVVAAQNAAQLSPLDATELGRTVASGVEAWQALYDATHGGFSEPPKHYHPELLRFLLSDPATREMALATLRPAINGAVRDPLDGGFFRYASDAEWRLPYFQKHLVDQARLALALLDAGKQSGDASFTEAARDALHFVLKQLPAENGGFVNALDGTPEPIMAAQLWTMAEIKSALGDKVGDQACTAFGVTAAGNLPADAMPGITSTGKNLLFHADPAAEKSLADAKATLLKIRHERAAPLRDNAAASGPYGLLLAAFARVGAESNDKVLTAAAQSTFAYLRDQLITKEGTLRQVASRPEMATPADYAMVISGLLTFKSAHGHDEAGKIAESLSSTLNAQYLNAESGRYFVTNEDPKSGIWARVYAPVPSASEPPSAEALMVEAIATQHLPGNAEPFARALAAEANDSMEAPRGDLLLALRTFAQNKQQ
ncbi:MAG TPA: DUF255 domain-containing protein [Opitutus sp.]|nr:DUF255 domain-containing protein [Opitutus sp.]